MQVGALGDIHGAFDTVHDIMTRHPDVPLWVQVGDIASNDGEYFQPIRPLFWIKGNNQAFDMLAPEATREFPPPIDTEIVHAKNWLAVLFGIQPVGFTL